MNDEQNPLIEACVVTDTFVTELGLVEHLGSCVRLRFAVQQKCVMSGKPERAIVAALVLPVEALHDVCAKILRDTGKTGRPVAYAEAPPDRFLN